MCEIQFAFINFINITKQETFDEFQDNIRMLILNTEKNSYELTR